MVRVFDTIRGPLWRLIRGQGESFFENNLDMEVVQDESRDILPKLGYYKPASIQCSFLPPLGGANGKMSSSEDNAIYTTDSPKEVERKIKRYAFSGGRDTLEEHRRHGGNPDIDVSFQYLRHMFESDEKKLREIHNAYKSGAMTSGELKQITINKINEFLKEHQKKRELAKKKIESFMLKK
jgi:tryptophanyl-tRNA synthetase